MPSAAVAFNSGGSVPRLTKMRSPLSQLPLYYVACWAADANGNLHTGTYTDEYGHTWKRGSAKTYTIRIMRRGQRLTVRRVIAKTAEWAKYWAKAQAIADALNREELTNPNDKGQETRNARKVEVTTMANSNGNREGSGTATADAPRTLRLPRGFDMGEVFTGALIDHIIRDDALLTRFFSRLSVLRVSQVPVYAENDDDDDGYSEDTGEPHPQPKITPLKKPSGAVGSITGGMMSAADVAQQRETVERYTRKIYDALPVGTFHDAINRLKVNAAIGYDRERGMRYIGDAISAELKRLEKEKQIRRVGTDKNPKWYVPREQGQQQSNRNKNANAEGASNGTH